MIGKAHKGSKKTLRKRDGQLVARLFLSLEKRFFDNEMPAGD